MVEPVKHHSRSKARRRKSQILLRPKKLIRCKTCQELTLPHRICPNCGFYKGRQYLTLEKGKKK